MCGRKSGGVKTKEERSDGVIVSNILEQKYIK